MIKINAKESLIKYLSKRGNEIATKALASTEGHTYQRRTGNLGDSYVWCVYEKGKPVAYGTARPQSATTARHIFNRDMYGSSEAKDFAYSFKASPKTISLVVAAVMPYAKVLENGGANIKHKYRVISGAREELQGLMGKFKGSRVRIISDGKAQ